MRSKEEMFNVGLEAPIAKGFKDDVSLIKYQMRPLSFLHDVSVLGSSTALERALDPDAFGDTYAAVVTAYQQAGKRAAKQAPWATGFSLGEERIAQFIRDHVTESIKRIADGQKTDVPAAIQKRISEGWSKAKIARELVGRKIGTQYYGGIIGLSGNGITSSDNARQQLMDLDKDYFNRRLRLKKYDRDIERAIKNGKPLSAAKIDEIVGSYQARLLESRAKMLALTEVTTAVNATKLRTFIKAATAAGVSLDQLEKTWHTVGDSHVRFTHRVLQGKNVTLSQKFISPSGAALEYPGDPSAPFDERAGCRCHMTIKWIKR